MDDLSGKTLKGYKLLERAGAGDRGAVYRALQPALGREVALKVIAPGVANDPDFIRRFEIEAQLVARLEHLHIAPLYDFWRDPDGAYLVMRWLRGGSLRQALVNGPLDVPATVQLVDQIAAALALAHSHRVVHGDLKPSNILLDEEGNAFLSDFNIAWTPLGNGVQAREPILGSFDYLAPEVARGQEKTPRTDLYGLGLTLYEMLSGRHPFPDLSSVERLYKHIDDPLPPLETAGMALPREVLGDINDVIQKATAKDPAERFEDARGMAAALRGASGLDEEGRGPMLEETLTLREQEILAHIVQGQTNRQIARDLFVELPTVKWHIGNLYRKMGVRNRVQAVARARDLQLLHSDEGEAREREGGGETTRVTLTTAVNPYKGLRPFEAADSRDFHGREAFVEQLLERLDQREDLARFLALVGPSGSGKSSLLSAGLVPVIWAGRLPGSERWYVVEMTPGARPLDALEVALTRIAAEQATNLNAHLRRDVHGLVRAASLILPGDGSELFLVIDQFEELFVLGEDGATSDYFLDLLYQAVVDSHSRVRVVIGMRADFYDKPLYHPRFGELLRSRMATLLPLSSAELERAIHKPAEQVGVTFEPGLVARITEEIQYQPGALPLLQYALTELFEGRQDRLMTHETYETIGGVAGALALRADELYLGFDRTSREAARQMFLRLVNSQDGTGDGRERRHTRQRVGRSELLALAEDPDMVDEVIDTFGTFRLLTLDHDGASRRPTVELAHEALIYEWQRYESWVEASLEDLRQYQRFRALAREWERSQRAPGYLLRQARLDQFASWARETDLALTPEERAFLDAGVRSRASRQEEEEARRRHELETAQRLAATEALRAGEQAQANRRLRWLVLGLAALLLAAAGATLFAVSESNRAQEQGRLASARELATEAMAHLETDPELSIHLALRAVRTTQERDGFVLPVAEEALHRALQTSRVRFTIPQRGGVTFSPDGAYLVTGSASGAIGIWNAGSGARLDTFSGHHAPITSIAFNHDGSLLASASADHQRIVREFATGRIILDLPGFDIDGPSPTLGTVAFSPDGRYLLATAQVAEAGIWDIALGREIVHFDDNAGPTGAFSPDGDRLALMIAVWDIAAIVGDGRRVGGRGEGEGPAVITWQERLFDYADTFIEFDAPSSEIENTYHEPGSVSFSPDGARLLTTVISSIAVMRDAHDGAPLFTLTGHSSIINGTAFEPHSEFVATASADGTARLWDAASGQMLLVLQGHKDEVVHVAFSPDGRRLATGSLDGTTKVWDISQPGGGEWVQLETPQSSQYVAFNPTTSHLLAVSLNGNARYIDALTGKTLFTLDAAQGAYALPAFSPDGALLALVDGSSGVQIVTTSDGTLWRSLQVSGAISTLTFSPDGRLLLAGREDGILTILELESGDVAGEWLVQDGFVNGLVLSHDGQRLAIAGADGEILVARLDQALSVQTSLPSSTAPNAVPGEAIEIRMTGHSDVIIGLDSSPDGEKLVSGSWDGSARVWDAASGDPLLTLTGHRGRVSGAAFGPDGQRIVTAGADGMLIVWDGASGERLFVLDSGPHEIVASSFSGDGKLLATVDAEGNLRLYVMPVADLVALASERLTRELTTEECRRFVPQGRCHN